ncbi:S8 family peptidase [Peribacillus muralis]|uniref:S8 family peptidase n=1 Tax=Peribacillus muralis TaxID=264697 RepID=UPI003D03B8B3
MSSDNIKLIPNKLISVNKIEEAVPMNIKNVGSDFKWNQGFTGKGIVIAVLDTGCDVNHPDLSSRIIGGYNFTEDHDGNTSIYLDTNGHGTHVSGIIASTKNGQGVVGVAPNANLLILKVLNQYGSGSIKDLIEAIHYAIDWTGVSGEKVRVISLSLGTKSSSTQLHQAVKRATENGISVVVAAGNDGDGDPNTNEYRYPGAYEEVIEVGAVDGNNEIAHFSNTNEFVDLYAPGVNIHSTYLDQEFAVLSGTSMASPHVAGAIAILIDEFEGGLGKKLSEKEIYQILMNHTTVRNVNNSYSHHILNLSKQFLKERKLS